MKFLLLGLGSMGRGRIRNFLELGVEPVEGFLDKVAKITRKNGALLIFDEIVNSPRLRIGGGGESYNVVPDISTFSEGIGNGWPISTIIGKKEFMKEMEKIFFSFTMGGETLSLAAAIATLTEIEEGNIGKILEVLSVSKIFRQH